MSIRLFASTTFASVICLSVLAMIDNLLASLTSSELLDDALAFNSAYALARINDSSSSRVVAPNIFCSSNA
jgi:hypothetical protein